MLRRWRAAWPHRRGRFDPPWQVQAPTAPTFPPLYIRRRRPTSMAIRHAGRAFRFVSSAIIFDTSLAIGTISVQATVGEISSVMAVGDIGTDASRTTSGQITIEATLGTIS